MSKQELFRRYIVFFLALTIGACGVTLVTRSHLGVNSVACLSYVSSIYLPVTMGTVVIIFNLSMLILQFFLYKRVELKYHLMNLLLQIPALFFFGVLVDIFMFLTKNFNPDFYLVEFAALIFGSILIAFNIALQATANVTMLSCDAFVKVLAEKINKKLGSVKLIYDVILVASAACIALIFSHGTEIQGIREGTVIGAIIIGPLVQLMFPRCAFFKRWILQSA
ncbi:DUF6198 family protein [uncultured Succinatimonas sp.]|uniref:YczE/YyaS/YitT family protein n=1 Tax=uncultured Succinatimonas sp. TaxID=1262973 RepID=UPI0025D53214|nr:DUF6198 family protein [uncultured Succinatimonas sp.]